jgi:HEAT repeat protein
VVKDIIEVVQAGSFKATSSDLLDLENLDLESSLLLLAKGNIKICMHVRGRHAESMNKIFLRGSST